MTSGVDEEEAAVDTCILDVPVANRGKLFTEIRAVLVLDIFDNRVPAVRGEREWLARVFARGGVSTRTSFRC